MKKNPETERLIEETWSAREADAGKNNRLLFPGTLYRLADWSEASGTLDIVFGFADYKDLVGTNLCHPEIAEKYGTEYRSNGTAACSVVVTVDHKLAVQPRRPLAGILYRCGRGDRSRPDPRAATLLA